MKKLNPKIKDKYRTPDESPDVIEKIQKEETRVGLQSDDEEWQQELTGTRPDNGYLPGQRLAERGVSDKELPLSP